MPEAIPFRTLGPVSGATKVVIGILLLIGVASVVVAAGTGTGRVWETLQFNWLFWSSLSLGMVLFAAALQMSNADWAWSVRRFALGGGTFLPISFVLFLIILFGGYKHLFRNWLGNHTDPAIFKKIAWLNWPGVAVRDIFVILVLYGLAMVYMYYRVRPDVYGVKNTEHRSFYDRITSGFRGVEEEAASCHKVSMRIAPVLAILYGLLWGVISVDQAMSIQPDFYSTMFPPAFIWTGFDAGVAMTAIMVAVLHRRMRLEKFVMGRQFHDLGMLVFAFSVFWMYLNWAQYIVIWYGQLPFEQIFFLKRFAPPYGPVASAVVIFIFVLPFLGLLARPPKKIPAVLAFFAVLILIGEWLERYLLVYPSLEGSANGLPLGFIEVGTGLGFLGLFLTGYLWYLRRVPILPSPATLRARGSVVVAVPAEAA